MNRAEIRREKHEKNPTYNLTHEQIQYIKDYATTDAIDKAFLIMMGLPLMVLHDKNGWGKKRLTEFSDNIIELYDSFQKDYLTLDDIIKAIKDETGVEFMEEMKRKKGLY